MKTIDRDYADYVMGAHIYCHGAAVELLADRRRRVIDFPWTES